MSSTTTKTYARLRLRIPKDKLPNMLLYRDTLYIRYRDGTELSLSVLSKLAEAVDAYLNGKVSELVIETDYFEVKTGIEEAKLLASGLVAEYLFYEGSGDTLHDTSGNGNHGTIYGATWKQEANGKWCLEFDGVDDCVAATLKGFNTTDGTVDGYITDPVVVLGAVVRPYDVDTTEQGIYIGEMPACYYGVRLLIVYEPKKPGYLAWLHHADGSTGLIYNVVNYVVEANRPYFLLVQLIKVDDYHVKAKFYVNNKKVDERTCTLSKPFYAWYARPRWFYIAHGIEYKQHYFKGKIYWCIVGKAELSDDKVETMYKLAKVMVPDLP